MPDFDIRLPALIEAAFDEDIYQRRISISRDEKIDEWLTVLK